MNQFTHDTELTSSVASASPISQTRTLHDRQRGRCSEHGNHGGLQAYKAKPVPHKTIISASQGDNPMIQNARGLSPSQLIQSV